MQLVFLFAFTNVFGAFDLNVFAQVQTDVAGFNEDSILIEETDEYKIYQNSDGSKTFTMMAIDNESDLPVKEGLAYSDENSEFAFESKDDTADVYLNGDLDKGEATLLLENDGLEIEVIPIATPNTPDEEISDGSELEPCESEVNTDDDSEQDLEDDQADAVDEEADKEADKDKETQEVDLLLNEVDLEEVNDTEQEQNIEDDVELEQATQQNAQENDEEANAQQQEVEANEVAEQDIEEQPNEAPNTDDVNNQQEAEENEADGQDVEAQEKLNEEQNIEDTNDRQDENPIDESAQEEAVVNDLPVGDDSDEQPISEEEMQDNQVIDDENKDLEVIDETNQEQEDESEGGQGPSDAIDEPTLNQDQNLEQEDEDVQVDDNTNEDTSSELADSDEQDGESETDIEDVQIETNLENYSYYDRSYEKIVYTDVFEQDVDIEYIPITGGVKENIIINEPTENSAFKYKLNLNGMKAYEEDNAIFVENKDGETAFVITAPSMKDAKGVTSYDIDLKLSRSDGNGIYYMIVQPNEDWLTSEDRVYPIVVDPDYNLPRDGILSCTAVYDSYKYSRGDGVTSIGYELNHPTGARRNYIKPELLDKDGIIIVKAQLKVDSVPSSTYGGNVADLYKVTSPWDSSTISWSNHPSNEDDPFVSAAMYGNANYPINITGYIQDCYPSGNYDGSKNTGILMRAESEYYSAGHCKLSNLTLEITYNDMQSIPAPTVTSHSKGAGTGKGYIDVSWDAVSGANKYYVAIFNGDEYELIDAGNNTSWSSDGEGIWPTQTQINAGRYKLNVSGGGDDLSMFPNYVYQNAPGTAYNNDNRYHIKVIPYNSSGPMSAPRLCMTKSITLPDSIGPSIPTLSVMPSGYTSNETMLLSWSDIEDYNGTEFVLDNLSKVEYKIDAGEWVETGIVTSAHNNFAISTAGLADGQHSIYLRGTDTLSNVGEVGTAKFYIDRTGPDSPDITVISDWYKETTMDIDWTSVSDSRGLDRIEYRFDSDATWLSTGEITSPFNDYSLNISGLDNGTHTIHLRGIDTCDNDGDSVSAQIKIDRADPSFDSFSSSAALWKNTNSVNLSWLNLADVHSGLSTLEYKIDSGSLNGLALTDTSKVLDVAGFADGSYTATLKATDNAGNSYEDSVDIKLDRINPSNSILSPSEGDLVKGLVEIWASSDDTNLSNTVLKAYRYSSDDSLIETIDIISNSNSYSNELLGVLDTSSYDEDDKVKLELKTTDLAGNTSTSTVNIKIDADSIAIDPMISIGEPVKNATVDETEERIIYTRDSGAPGSVSDHNLFVDGDFFEAETSGHSLRFQSLLYEENSLHNIAVVCKNSSGDFEYSQGLARHIVFVDTLSDVASVSASENIVFESDGAKLEAGKTSGYIITKPISFLDNDIVYNLDIPSIIPSSTSLAYEISFDNGASWESVSLKKDKLIVTKDKDALIKIIFDGTSAKTPIAKGIDVGGVKVSSKYNVKVQFMSEPENLKEEENKSKYIKIAWDENADSEVKYNVYRGESSDFDITSENMVAEKISNNYYEDEDVSEGTRYFYKVQAYKDFGVSDPYISERVSETCEIEVEAYTTPPSSLEKQYSTVTEGDGEENALNDHVWGDPEEIAAAENANSIYGGDFTVNHDAEPPMGSDEMNESMLGLREVCAAGFEPINFNTGNFFMETKDADIATMPGLTDSIIRVYNVQADEDNGPFGDGWAFGYSVHLKIYDNGDVGMVKPDGHLSVFRLGSNGKYIDDSDEQHSLAIENAKYVITNYDGSKYIFTSGGLLEQVKSANGNTDKIIYDDNGLIDKVVLDSGKEVDFSLDEKGHIISIELTDHKMLTYTYDENTLTSFTDTAGNTIRYVYDNQGRMIEWYDKAGVRQVKNIYDDEDRVTEQWDGKDSYYKLEYNDGYTVTTNAEGDKNSFYFDDLGRSTKLIDSDGKSQSFEYNEFNLVIKYTDQAGRTIDYDYDDRGNLLLETNVDGRSREYMYDIDDNMIAKSDYMGNWTSYKYDKNKNVTKLINPDNSVYEYTYNANNQLTKETNALGMTTRYYYRGTNLYKVTDANGNVSRNYYDVSNNLIKTIDSKGNATKLEYDELNQLVKTTLPDGASLRYEYDSVGNMVAMFDAYGVATKYKYDNLRQLVKIMNPDGTQVRYEYDKKGNLVKTIEPDGKATVNVYDKKNNLISTSDNAGLSYNYYYNPMGDLVGSLDSNNAFSYLDYDKYTGWLKSSVNPDGAKTIYDYDNNGNVTCATYADGSKVSYEYDSMGRVKATTLPNGTKTSFEYDALGRLIKGVDAVGNETTYVYDKLNNLMSVTNALGYKTTFEYDSAGNMTAQIDAMGNKTEFEFDETNQMEKIINPRGGINKFEYDKNGQTTKVMDALGAISESEYDKMGRVVASINPLGAKTTLEYDLVGNLTKEINAIGSSTTYAYDKSGNITKVNDAAGGELLMAYDDMNNIIKLEGENGFVENYVYDKSGRVTNFVDGEGYEKTYSYDILGRLTREGDNTGKYVKYTYDKMGNIRSTINAQKQKTEFLYDDIGNLTSVHYADGSYDSYHYDGLFNLIKEVDRKGRTTVYKYDKVGNVIKVTHPGNVVNGYEYDAEYNLIKEIAPDGTVTNYEYDKNGNLITTMDALGNTTSLEYNIASMVEKVVDAKDQETVTIGYDALGNIACETDALGNVTAYEYDALARLTKVTDPLMRVTNYTYDKADNLTKIIDGNGNETKYAYDSNNRLISETDAIGNVESYSYMKDGLLESVIKADGTKGMYSYDMAGRMKAVDYSDGTNINYGYNEVGSITQMNDSTGTTTYQYDKLQRLVSTTDSNDKTVKYTYDWQGRKYSVTMPDGKKNVFSYDIMDRLTQVKDESGIIAQYSYDKVGQLVSNKREDITTLYEYDALGQITELVTKDPNETLMSFSYRYDEIGNITRKERQEGDKTTVRKYAYDKANQLTSMRENDSYKESFAYDNAGNMSQKIVNDVATDFVYNQANQLISETVQAKTITHIHNQNGDLISKSTGEKYAYDAMGNLSSIKGNGIDQRFTYNGNGDRMSKTDSGKTITYVNDINTAYTQVLQTYDENNQVINTYDYGIERIRSRGETDETYLYDATGNVVASLNPKDEMVSYAYTAFGDLMPDSPQPTTFGYNGEDMDYTTGLQYLRARYYDVTTGRFVQRDKYKGESFEPQTFNRYIYVGNNPVNWIDPSGYHGLPIFGGSSSKSGSYTSFLKAESKSKVTSASSTGSDYSAFLQAEAKGREAPSTPDNKDDTYKDSGTNNQPLNTYDHAKDLDGNGVITADELLASEWGTLVCSAEERADIYMRMATMDQYKDNIKLSNALGILWEVINSEATKEMTTNEIMVQFASQFDGQKNYGDVVDNSEARLPYDNSREAIHDSFDTYNDCAGFVQELNTIFHGRMLGSKDGEPAESGFQQNQYETMRNNENFVTSYGKFIQMDKERIEAGDLIYLNTSSRSTYLLADGKNNPRKTSHVVVYVGYNENTGEHMIIEEGTKEDEYGENGIKVRSLKQAELDRIVGHTIGGLNE